MSNYSNAPRIPPGRVILSMRCWLALKSTGLGSLGWAGCVGCAGVDVSSGPRAPSGVFSVACTYQTKHGRATFASFVVLSCFFCRRLGGQGVLHLLLSCFIFQSLGARMAPGGQGALHLLLSCFIFHELGGQYGSMRAPAGRPGGCKTLMLPWFYKVFRFSMHPARWLILFAHVANSEAQLRFPRPRGFQFPCVFLE